MFFVHVSSVGCSRKVHLVESGSGTKLGVDPKEPSQQEINKRRLVMFEQVGSYQLDMGL